MRIQEVDAPETVWFSSIYDDVARANLPYPKDASI